MIDFRPKAVFGHACRRHHESFYRRAYQSFGDTTLHADPSETLWLPREIRLGRRYSLRFYDGSLSIRVLRNRNSDDGIEFTFLQVDGFRLLDEVSLAEYWIADDFPSAYPVLEVSDGGWAHEEDKRLGYTKQQREWIIVTAGACVSVFSKHEPEIHDAVFPAEPEVFTRG